MTRVGLDIDEVLARYAHGFVRWHADRYAEIPAPRMWHTGDVAAYLDVDREEAYERLSEFMEECLERLVPVNGSEDGVSSLRGEVSFVAVTRRPERFYEETWHWLVRHYGDVFDAVECTTHLDDPKTYRCKGKVCVAHDVDIFVDDKPEHVRRVEDQGVKGVLMRRPWNDSASDLRSVSDWSELRELLGMIR